MGIRTSALAPVKERMDSNWICRDILIGGLSFRFLE